ncbi:MAG: NCS2 family permease [Deltaproteobacteria bacterium]|jgi:AGZA family xanthine/uracil permease-like MFS transporter|nr:NCS2 family permease [Deltaproteobacteria bacterium]
MFNLKSQKISPFIEISAGLTTFFSMVYVLAANPHILSQAGMDRDALFTATALGTIVATLIMAFVANLPFAVAPGMGLNAFFVVIATQMGYSWPQALTAVLISGSIFVLLSISPLRQIILREVPETLQLGVCAGIGLMIAYIGLLNSGVILPGPALGDIAQGKPLLFVFGLLATGILMALKFRFAILFGIIITTIIGIPLGITNTAGLSEGFVSLPPSFSQIAFKFDFSAITSFDFIGVIIALLFMEVVDGLAGFLGLFSVMGADAERYKPRIGRAFIADSMGVVVGSCLGLSPNTTYAESGAGVAAGGRTGLTALVVAICFFIALFVSPLFLMIPFSAVAPALVVVGLLMVQSVAKLNFKDITESFPAFATLILIALSWRISDSLAIGWQLYIIMKVISGNYRKITVTVWVVGIIFALKTFL